MSSSVRFHSGHVWNRHRPPPGPSHPEETEAPPGGWPTPSCLRCEGPRPTAAGCATRSWGEPLQAAHGHLPSRVLPRAPPCSLQALEGEELESSDVFI